jgi:hypothetical protein
MDDGTFWGIFITLAVMGLMLFLHQRNQSERD